MFPCVIPGLVVNVHGCVSALITDKGIRPDSSSYSRKRLFTFLDNIVYGIVPSSNDELSYYDLILLCIMTSCASIQRDCV